MPRSSPHDSHAGSTSESDAGAIAGQMWDRVDSLILVLVRVVTGITIYFWADSFIVEEKYEVLFRQPRFLFKYAGLEWVQLWPGNGIYWHFVVAKIAGVCLAAGLLTRVSAAILCAAITYVLLVERQIYVNHYYLLACLAGLLVFLPAGRCLAVDSRIGIERRQCEFRRWQLWLLRFQLGIPYVFGGLAKLNGDWLRGQPAELILRSRTDFGSGPLSEVPGAVEVMAYGGFLYDLLVVPMLLYRRTRWIAVALSLVFHLSNAITLSIGVFPWFMLATLVVFFPVETLSRRLRLFLGQRVEGAGVQRRAADDSGATTSIDKLGLALALAYVSVQVVLPMRPWVYPGDANWNQRGHQLAWRMMLRDKQALTRFLLVDPDASEYIVAPSTIILTPNQAAHADHHPELIRQTAVQLKELAREELGVADCRVHALALVSLNGRRPTGR